MYLALLALLEVELQQPNMVVNRFPMVCPLLETQGLQLRLQPLLRLLLPLLPPPPRFMQEGLLGLVHLLRSPLGHIHSHLVIPLHHFPLHLLGCLRCHLLLRLFGHLVHLQHHLLVRPPLLQQPRF